VRPAVRQSGGRADEDLARSVNFTAFEPRLVITWASRVGSPAAPRHVRVAGDDQLEALGPGRLGEHVATWSRPTDLEVEPLELELAGLDLGEVEDVVDDASSARLATWTPDASVPGRGRACCAAAGR
jgi:hypothetical protein